MPAERRLGLHQTHLVAPLTQDARAFEPRGPGADHQRGSRIRRRGESLGVPGATVFLHHRRVLCADDGAAEIEARDADDAADALAAAITYAMMSRV